MVCSTWYCFFCPEGHQRRPHRIVRERMIWDLVQGELGPPPRLASSSPRGTGSGYVSFSIHQFARVAPSNSAHREAANHTQLFVDHADLLFLVVFVVFHPLAKSFKDVELHGTAWTRWKHSLCGLQNTYQNSEDKLPDFSLFWRQNNIYTVDFFFQICPMGNVRY